MKTCHLLFLEGGNGNILIGPKNILDQQECFIFPLKRNQNKQVKSLHHESCHLFLRRTNRTRLLAKYIVLANKMPTEDLKRDELAQRAAKLLTTTDLWLLPTMNPDG